MTPYVVWILWNYTTRGFRILLDMVEKIKWRSTMKFVTTFRNKWPAIWRGSNNQRNHLQANKDPETPSEYLIDMYF